MPESLKPIAKAVAGFLAPLILGVIAKALGAVDVDVPFDVTWVETLVTSAITAVAVYATRNRPAV